MLSPTALEDDDNKDDGEDYGDDDNGGVGKYKDGKFKFCAGVKV